MRNRVELVVIACFLAMLVPVFGGSDNTKVLVDLHAHRAKIREGLLRQTPLGTRLEDVLRFIATQLERSGDEPPKVENGPATGPAAEASLHRGVKSVHVYLGQYYEHPEVVFLTAPMLMQREVSAQWAFDKQDCLIDIFVDKNTGVY